jgi:hypothetical protein
MSTVITILRHRIEVKTRGMREARTIPLDGRSALPMLIGLLHTADRSGIGVPEEVLWQSKPFCHLKTLDNFRRTAARYAEALETKLADRRELLSIVRELGSRRGRYRLVMGADVTLALAPGLEALLREDERTDAAQWLNLPVHDLHQLAIFVEAIQAAAREFDEGQLDDAEARLKRSLDDVTEPRYRAVILFRMVRAMLRRGAEAEAERLIDAATELIESMPHADPVLVSRVHYNRAWLAYTQGDFGYTLINRAMAALERAAPDDIRHSFVATQYGLIVVKDLERNVDVLAPSRAVEKAREALAYLTHAIYLFTRAEDFWGVQEACSNLAFGLFHIGSLAKPWIAGVVGSRQQNNEEIAKWIEISAAVGSLHFTGSDSVRNELLLVSVAMAREGDLDFAWQRLNGAMEAKQVSPRELGRLYEHRIEYNLRLAVVNPGRRRELESEALKAYWKAWHLWNELNHHSLLDKLEARYEVEQDRMRRKRQR